ncbi:MAG TPA: HepT-like ribonuclease domain-containing protein [Leptolyngbyaceae cyanobacterium]
MSGNSRDLGSLWDMQQAICKIQEFTENLTRDAYLDSALIQSAVERQLEILGEAARRLSDEFRQTHTEIDWRRIIGLRNILIHRYDEIRQQMVWEVVASELEPLSTQLEALLPPLTDQL